MYIAAHYTDIYNMILWVWILWDKIKVIIFYYQVIVWDKKLTKHYVYSPNICIEVIFS